MTSARGLSQPEGILTPRFDYAHEPRDVPSIACHDCEPGTEMHDDGASSSKNCNSWAWMPYSVNMLFD